MAELQANPDATIILHKLIKESQIFSPEYYSALHSTIKEIAQTCLVDYSEAYKYVNKGLLELQSVLSKEAFPDFIASASILNVLMSPFHDAELAQKSKFFQKKGYKDFNIDIGFFANIRRCNYEAYYGDHKPEMIVSVLSCEFKRGKLSKLVLERKMRGLKYVYDSKYKFRSIIFADGVEVKI